MAAIKVFDTVELTEAVLAYLPLPSLLRAQAVCRDWQSVVKGSSLLQQRLFLEPIKDETVWLVDVTNLSAQQRQLRRDFKSFIRVRAEALRNSDDCKLHHGLMLTPASINPLFLRTGVLDMRSPHYHESEIDVKADNGVPVQLTLSIPELEMLRAHTVRDMLLTQPPVRQVCVEAKLIDDDSDQPEEVTIHGLYFLAGMPRGPAIQIYDGAGVKLGSVLQAVEDMSKVSKGFEQVDIHLSGVVEVSAADKQVVQKRTEEWRDLLASAEKESKS